MNANALQAANAANDDRLPAPETEDELQERLSQLEAVYAADGWEGVERPEQQREVLRQYALGQIGLSEAMKEFARYEQK